MARIALIALAGMLLGSDAGAQEASPPPALLVGDFVDDYGSTHTISTESWIHGSAEYRVVSWDAEAQHAIAQNAERNPTERGLWSRFDWVLLDASSEYPWAYCQIVYDAEDEQRARDAAPANREEPRNGCNGHPYTRMKRKAGVG